MASCIYCNERIADSEEDFLPKCMGKFRNFERLKNKLCRVCNNKIGKVDEQFCRCGPEAFFRRILGIKGRRHHKSVNPYYRGSSGGSHIIIESSHPTLDCTIFFESEKLGEAFPARQIIVNDCQGKYHSILITENIRNAQHLLFELKAKGLANAKLVECWASPDEEEWMHILCKSFDVKISFGESATYTNVEKKKFIATFTVNNNYFRGVAKIAFHYFLKYFDQFTGYEKEFEAIKQVIIDDGNPDLCVRQMSGSFIYGLKSHITTDKYGHFVAIDKNESAIRCKIHFFVGPGIVPHRYYEVYIGKNPGKIIYSQAIGHQFVISNKKIRTAMMDVWTH